MSFTFSPYVNLLIRFEDFRVMLGLLIVGLSLDGALNLALIPSAGATGAAIATSIASGLINTSIFVRSLRFRYVLARRDSLEAGASEVWLAPTRTQLLDGSDPA